MLRFFCRAIQVDEFATFRRNSRTGTLRACDAHCGYSTSRMETNDCSLLPPVPYTDIKAEASSC